MLSCTVQIHHTGRRYRHERTERKDIFKTFANIRAWMPPTHESGAWRRCQHCTAYGQLQPVASYTIQAARSHHKQTYRKHGSLLILLSRLRHVHHCWWHAARCKWQRMLTCAATAWHRSRPTNPRGHRCDCRAIRPTTGVAAPSGSMYIAARRL